MSMFVEGILGRVANRPRAKCPAPLMGPYQIFPPCYEELQLPILNIKLY